VFIALILCANSGICTSQSGMRRWSGAFALRQTGAENFLLIACSVSRFYKNYCYFKYLTINSVSKTSTAYVALHHF